MGIARKLTGRRRRQLRVRQKIRGTSARPRLTVTRSLRHMYAQLIDDDAATTLVAASTMEPGVRGERTATGNVDAAREVGRAIAERAREKGIVEVVFDRAGNRYHGRVRAVAEGAREAGLKF